MALPAVQPKVTVEELKVDLGLGLSNCVLSIVGVEVGVGVGVGYSP